MGTKLKDMTLKQFGTREDVGAVDTEEQRAANAIAVPARIHFVILDFLRESQGARKIYSPYKNGARTFSF